MSRSASTPSDPWGEAAAGPPPAWLGDVSDGVDAWTRSTPSARPDREQTRSRRGERAERSVPPPDPADPREGRDADPESVARKILLDQLTGQARSRKELADKLAQRNVPADLASRLLDRFEEVGLVDDEAFARAWIQSRQPGKGLARRALAQELRRKGVDDEVAEEALAEIDPEDEREAGRALVRKKLRSMQRLDDQTKTRRLVGMLVRKGYPPGTAFALVREEVGAEALDDPGDGTDAL